MGDDTDKCERLYGQEAVWSRRRPGGRRQCLHTEAIIDGGSFDSLSTSKKALLIHQANSGRKVSASQARLCKQTPAVTTSLPLRVSWGLFPCKTELRQLSPQRLHTLADYQSASSAAVIQVPSLYSGGRSSAGRQLTLHCCGTASMRRWEKRH